MKRKTAQRKKKERIKRRVAANKTPVKAPAKKTATKKTAEKSLSAYHARGDESALPTPSLATQSASPRLRQRRNPKGAGPAQRMTVVW